MWVNCNALRFIFGDFPNSRLTIIFETEKRKDLFITLHRNHYFSNLKTKIQRHSPSNNAFACLSSASASLTRSTRAHGRFTRTNASSQKQSSCCPGTFASFHRTFARFGSADASRLLGAASGFAGRWVGRSSSAVSVARTPERLTLVRPLLSSQVRWSHFELGAALLAGGRRRCAR